MKTPIENLLDASKAIVRHATDDKATEGGYLINARLIGRLEDAIKDAECELSESNQG